MAILRARYGALTLSAGYLAFNFASSIAGIFLGKLVMSGLQFEFSCLLTALHYIATTIGLEIMRLCGVYSKRESPLTPRLLLLCALVGSAPALNNLSLRYNNLGFYQVNKLLVTPCIVSMEWGCFGITVSRARLAALLAICIGVGAASVSDVSVTLAGCLASCATLPLNAAYKALWSRVQKQESWSTLSLMRRVLPRAKFAEWLGGFLPGLGEDFVLQPAVVTDKSDGKLAHLDGLNLARAWMLEGVAAGLGADDPRTAAVSRCARAHREAGLAAVTGEHYEGGHWLGSFAVYLVTKRGL